MVTGISLPRIWRFLRPAIVADMRRRVIPVFAVLACLAATPALAHPPPLGLTGFSGGLLHPLFVIDHVIALLALGLLMGSQERWQWLPPIGFAAGLVVGGGLMMFGAGFKLPNQH